MDDHNKERRQFPRVEVNAHVWVCNLDKDNKAVNLEDCVVIDVSEGGLKLACERKYAQGNVLVVTGQGGFFEGLHPVVGLITWCRHIDETSHLYGLKFLGLSDQVLAKIRECVNELLTNSMG